MKSQCSQTDAGATCICFIIWNSDPCRNGLGHGGKYGQHPKSGAGPGGGDFGDLDPFIVGLLRTLPTAGDEWDLAGRIKWLTTAANIFDLIYKGEGGIVVSSARADRSPHHHDNKRQRPPTEAASC